MRSKLMNNIKIGNTTISSKDTCYVIAEIGHNHQGKLELALEMIVAAAEAGANAVKFQKRTIDELYTKSFLNTPYDNENSYGKTYGEHRLALEFNYEQYVLCQEKAFNCGIDFLVTPFDKSAVDFCEKLGVKAYKIASGDITNEDLIRYIAGKGKPIILSTGTASTKEIDDLNTIISDFTVPFALLYTVSAYPTEIKHINLTRLTALKNSFPQQIIGYSGHEIGIETAVYAHVLGASIVEKHFTLDKKQKGTDHSFSLNKKELSQLVKRLNTAKEIMGSKQDNSSQINAYEENARFKMGKGLYASTDIPAGSILTKEKIVFKSPANSITPAKVNLVLGRKTISSISIDEPILETNLIV